MWESLTINIDTHEDGHQRVLDYKHVSVAIMNGKGGRKAKIQVWKRLELFENKDGIAAVSG